ncbi:MAG: apolipoprotein N-acyltransferase [Luteolibacter sp.]
MKFLQNLPARCALAVISGFIYAFAFPPVGWRWLILLGIAGLLISLHGQSGTRARLIGMLHGLAAFGLGLSWVLNIFGPIAFVLWCVLSVFTVLFAHIQGSAHLRGITGWKLALFTAINWSALEFIRAEVFPLKFPWMGTGLAVGPNLLSPWIGVYGVGFLVLCLVSFAFSRKWIPASAIAALLLMSVIFSKPHPAPAPADKGTVSVAGLQLEGVPLSEYLTGTRNIPGGTKHIVWPEYAIPYDIRAAERDWKLVSDLCREKNITLTFGTKAMSDGNGWRNIALTMDGSGFLGEHTKNHTVYFFNDGIAGQTALPIATENGKAGTPICFDGDYEGVIRKMTSAGAEYIVVPTMDAESWGAKQHDQHAELARMRAAENGRWIFVCATSGVSQLIDPSGHLHARLGAMKQGEISGKLKRETKLTPYTRAGWLFPWLVLAIAVALWIKLLFTHPPFHPDSSGVKIDSFGSLPISKKSDSE